MPGSITSVPPEPPILTYVLAVAALVTSLMLTSFGFTNNAWIVLYRPETDDEFQRGIRGHDCYRNHNEPVGKNIKCLPWDYPEKSAKFPEPFDHAIDPSIVVYAASILAKIILFSQFFWLVYTIGHCCSQKFSAKAEKLKLVFFHIMVIAVGFWIILLGLIVYETFTDKLLYRQMKKPEYEYQIGLGFWLFFAGGLLPFMGSLYCLFGDEVDASKTRLVAAIRKRQPVPNNDQEMVQPPA